MSRFDNDLVARAFRSYYSWLHRCGYSEEQIKQPAAYACVRNGDEVVLANSHCELARYAVERTPTGERLRRVSPKLPWPSSAIRTPRGVTPVLGRRVPISDAPM